MSASAALAGKPNVRLRGRSYPVVLPTWRDPRLHLAATIISLQVLGQVAFEFRLSIAQILVALGTCAVLEVGIAFFRHHVILWPASALLTGNGVAFVLRVPGTEHGDWWSMHGWWIFAGTAAVALLSKYLIRFRGRHIFNPSNFGLVLCFLLIGPERADPLELLVGADDARGWRSRSRSSSSAASRSSRACACWRSPSASGSPSPRASRCSPRAATG